MHLLHQCGPRSSRMLNLPEVVLQAVSHPVAYTEQQQQLSQLPPALRTNNLVASVFAQQVGGVPVHLWQVQGVQ